MQVSTYHVYLNLLKLRRANIGFVLDITDIYCGMLVLCFAVDAFSCHQGKLYFPKQ